MVESGSVWIRIKSQIRVIKKLNKTMKIGEKKLYIFLKALIVC